jgi:hypothetical protein
MMRKYVKKPMVVETVQWTGDNTTEVLTFCSDCYTYQKDTKAQLRINTLEGTMKASIGDYVIKGIIGEFYACKPDVFEQTYEEVIN